MKRDVWANAIVFLLLVALGVATRWLSKAYEPDLSNFTAAATVALFAGFYFSHWLPRFLAPSAVLVISNLWLDKYDNLWQMAVVYLSILLIVPLGWVLRQRLSTWRVAGFAVVHSVSFFLVTNSVFWPGFDLYPKTLAGQFDSYVAGIPFFRNMLAGDLFFAALVFGSYWLATSAGVLPRRTQLAPVVAK
jgi:hypothetical protein